MTLQTVVLVLRTGGEFLPEHVRTLVAGIEHWWRPKDEVPRIAVLTNAPEDQYGLLGHMGVKLIPLAYGYPGWWSKMELFCPANNNLGDILYFDLDTVVVGDLEDIASVRTLTLLQDFYRPTQLQSALMYLPLEDRPAVWESWKRGPKIWMRKFRGDQDFLEPGWGDRAERWQALLPGQVVSYKVHVKKKGKVPEDARVVCFHGRPRPWHLEGGLPQ